MLILQKYESELFYQLRSPEVPDLCGKVNNMPWFINDSFECPDLFITMTRNPQWPEIKSLLLLNQ